MIRLVLFLLFVLYFSTGFSQNVLIKKYDALRITDKIEIDGCLNESIWNSAEIATDFIEYEPKNNDTPYLNTEIKILYDNDALYIGAFMEDNEPDSILSELCIRDNDNANTDKFSIQISPFNDGINGFEFIITSSGIQIDKKITANSSDYNWDAVWFSEVKISENGWIAEIKIPYSALRFPKTEIQKWGINFWRTIRRNRETSSWNYVNIEKQGTINQLGTLENINNIKPPIRLELYPYFLSSIENYSENLSWNKGINGGLDLRYGINESFTLDMTLVPDFSQTESDDIELNLSPYETKYEEKRQFFTEGTELFNKCDIFYSRRIGGILYDSISPNLKTNEIVAKQPQENKLLNSTKISGRTKKGLGIGFFNSVTSNSYAEITDTLSNEKRKIAAQPSTNYNIIAFDKSLKNNSYISFINTNVNINQWRYSANVTGTEFNILDKANTYGLKGITAINQKYINNHTPDFGFKYFLQFSKISGKFNYSISHLTESDTYDPNDFGYLANNNNSIYNLSLTYKILKPFWKLNLLTNSLSIEHKSMFKPNNFNYIDIEYNINTTTKSRHSFGYALGLNPTGHYDYNETRTNNMYFKKPSSLWTKFFVSSDYRRRIAIDGELGYWKAFIYLNQGGKWGSISPRIRINDNMLFIYSSYYEKNHNYIGWVRNEIDASNNKIVRFGKRNVETYVNTLTTSYIFNKKTSVNLKIRHYLTNVVYEKFYVLNNDGTITQSIYEQNHNLNYNNFNIDFNFTYYFAPGSEFSVMWKNLINRTEEKELVNLFENISNTVNSYQLNTISLKILYYLDYKYLIKK